MKTKILVECPALISSVKIGVLSVLENRKECEVKFKRTIEINEKDIVWSDIVISVRGCERASLKIVKAANKAKRFTIMFLDDDLINIPLDLDSTKYYNDRELKKYIEKVLENSNVLWAVNPRIIKKYSKFTIEKKGILSKVPMEIENDIERVEFSTNPLKILYAGSIDHEKTLKKIINPVVKKFNDEISSGKVSFTFIGANPHIKNTKHYKYFESYEKYKKFVKEGRFSIGLAPIEITEFYKSKYYNKFLEYSSIGVLGIYTNSEPYKLVVRHNENGILCKNEVESWYSEIKKVIDNPGTSVQHHPEQSTNRYRCHNHRYQQKGSKNTIDFLRSAKHHCRYYAKNQFKAHGNKGKENRISDTDCKILIMKQTNIIS